MIIIPSAAMATLTFSFNVLYLKLIFLFTRRRLAAVYEQEDKHRSWLRIPFVQNRIKLKIFFEIQIYVNAKLAAMKIPLACLVVVIVRMKETAICRSQCGLYGG